MSSAGASQLSHLSQSTQLSYLAKNAEQTYNSVVDTSKGLLNDIGSLDHKILNKRKAELFDKIIENKDELGRRDAVRIVGHLFELSIEDGLYLADKLRLVPDVYMNIVKGHHFIIKHKSFVKKLLDAIGKHKNEITKLPDLEDKLGYIEIIIKSVDDYPNSGVLSLIAGKSYVDNSKRGQIKAQMDDIYKNYLALKKIKLEQPKDNRSTGDRLFDDFSNKILVTGKYVKENLIKTIYDSGVMKKHKDKDVFGYKKQKLVLKFLKKQNISKKIRNEIENNDMLDEKTFLYIKDKLNLELDENLIYQYKPLGLVFNAQAKLTEKNNKDELKFMLETRFKDKFNKDIFLKYDKDKYKYFVDGLDKKNDDDNTNQKDKKTASKDRTLDITPSSYKNISVPLKFGDQLGFKVGLGDGFYITDEDGNPISSAFSDISDHINIGKNFFLRCKIGDKRCIMLNGLNIVGDMFDDVGDPVNIGGKVAFKARIGNKQFVIDHNGNKVGDMFDFAGEPVDIGGNIAFMATGGDKEFIIDHNGNKIGGEFYDVRNPVNIGGKVAFRARNGDKTFVIDHSGNKIGGEFDEVGDPVNIGGNIAFKARNGNRRFVIDYNGNKIGGEFDYVGDPVDVGGDIAFMAKAGDKEFIIDHNGDKVGGEFDTVLTPVNIGGDIAFRAINGDKAFVIDHNGNKVGGEFDEVRNPVNIGGKFAFKARIGNKQFVVDHNGNKVGGEFADVRSPVDVGGNIIFKAIIGNKLCCIDHNGNKIGGEFDNVYIFSDYFVGRRDGKHEKWSFNLDGSAELVLNQDEQNKLTQLNLSIKQANLTKRQNKISKFKTKLENKNKNNKLNKRNPKNITHGMIAGFQNLIRQAPELFINSMSATEDRREDILVQKLLFKMFPELAYNTENNNKRYSGITKMLGSSSNLKAKAEDYLNDREINENNGGNPLEDTETIMEIDGNKQDLIVSGIFGKYDKNKRHRKKSYFYREVDNYGLNDISVITLPRINTDKAIVLAKPINSSIIQDSVVGLDSNGKEINLKNYIEFNSLYEAKLVIDSKTKDIQQIKYSYSTPKVSPKIPEISMQKYEIFKTKFEKEQGSKKPGKNELGKNELTEKLYTASQESKDFLKSISQLNIKEQFFAIEDYVRKKSIYDFENVDVMALRKGKTIEEKIYISEQRLLELKDNKPEDTNNFEDKKRAGVCSDFSDILLSELLREAGFISGVISGFIPEAGNVSGANAHSLAYVVVPDKNGKNQIITLDATPSDSIGGTSTSLQQKEKQNNKILTDIEEKLKSELLGIMNLDQNKDLDMDTQIKNNKILSENIKNGRLKEMLKLMIDENFDNNNTDKIKLLLNYYQYTPLKNKDINKINANDFEFESAEGFINEKKNNNKQNKILDIFEKFVKTNENKVFDAINILNKLIKINKNKFSKPEYDIMQLVVKYLIAKQKI